jgi:hypothetical protein
VGHAEVRVFVLGVLKGNFDLVCIYSAAGRR